MADNNRTPSVHNAALWLIAAAVWIDLLIL